GFRSDTSRRNSTPAHDWKAYPDYVATFVDRLVGVVVENRDAADVIRTHDGPETLHYVDPPYVQSTRVARHGYRHEMTDDDHRELAEVLRSVKGMVVISGYACDLYDDELYPDWMRVTRQTVADHARPRKEVLWLNDRA